MPRILDTRVVVVGAGLAGLSAAVHLQSLSVRTLVLEAQPCPGGRVRTHSLGHSKHNVELGATWFHGTLCNAALDVAVEAKLLEKPTLFVDDETSYTTLVFSTPAKLIKNGQVTTVPPEESMSVARAYAAALKQLEDQGGTLSPDCAVQEHLKKKLDWASMTARQQAVFRCCDLLEAIVNGCDDGTQHLSAARLNDYRTLEGDNLPPPRGGMTSLVNVLLGKLSNDTLLLNTEVVFVNWRGDGESFRPSVELNNGDVVRCDCIIWTPSLNVTKRACKMHVFQPDLPLEKQEAMNGRMQGTVEKGFAVLDRKLRDVDAHRAVPLLWEGHQPAAAEACGLAAHDDGWTCGVYALTYDPIKQTVGFWQSGRLAEQFCMLEEGEAQQQVERLLRKVYNQEVYVKEVVRSSWARNKFVLGSYSFPSVGCPATATEKLASPLPSSLQPFLCFAGEATHCELYSTMHGAMESGIREAKRCFGYLADHCRISPPL